MHKTEERLLNVTELPRLTSRTLRPPWVHGSSKTGVKIVIPWLFWRGLIYQELHSTLRVSLRLLSVFLHQLEIVGRHVCAMTIDRHVIEVVEGSSVSIISINGTIHLLLTASCTLPSLLLLPFLHLKNCTERRN